MGKKGILLIRLVFLVKGSSKVSHSPEPNDVSEFEVFKKFGKGFFLLHWYLKYQDFSAYLFDFLFKNVFQMIYLS